MPVEVVISLCIEITLFWELLCCYVSIIFWRNWQPYMIILFLRSWNNRTMILKGKGKFNKFFYFSSKKRKKNLEDEWNVLCHHHWKVLSLPEEWCVLWYSSAMPLLPENEKENNAILIVLQKKAKTCKKLCVTHKKQNLQSVKQ